MAGDKYYNAERARQAQFKKSEEALKKNYKQSTDDDTIFEYLNKLRPEDSTREYNEVEHYKKGGMTKSQKKIQKAYLGRAIRQPTETDNEFKIRHEYHTPFSDDYFKGQQKAKGGIAKGCGKVMGDRRKVTKMY